MKNIMICIIALIVGIKMSNAQTLPILGQKLTDGFLYNPSFAGLSGGSATFINKRQWTTINNSPEIFLLSAHTVLKQDKLGLGGNIYQEKVNFYKNFHASASFAYHTKLNKKLNMSFGLTTELFQTSLDRDKIFVKDWDDKVLTDFPDDLQLDFAVGAVISNEQFNVGFSFNRIKTALSNNNSIVNLNSYFLAQGNVIFPARNGADKLEPSIVYRNQKDGTDQLDIMLFYTYENLIIGGLAFRTGSILSTSIGLQLKNRIVLGYAYERIVRSTGKDSGPSHEISLRFNFNKQYYRSINPDIMPRNASTIKKKQKD